MIDRTRRTTASRRVCRLLAILTIGALVAAGCGVGTAEETLKDELPGEGVDEASDQNPGEANASTTSTATDAAPAAEAPDEAEEAEGAEGAEVTVKDPGAEPRVLLRTQVVAGQQEVMVLAQSQSLRQEVGGEAVGGIGEIPMIIHMDLTAEPADQNQLTYRSVIASAAVSDTVSPEIADQVQPMLDAMVGVATTAIVDDRARARSAEITGIDGLDPVVAAAVEQLVTSSQFTHPLPEAPVGVGAVWQVTQSLQSSGLNVEQVTNYEVVSIEGTVVELALTSEQFVPVGAEIAVLGASANVLAWEATTTGSVTYDLTSMVPVVTSQSTAVQELEYGPSTARQVLKQWAETTVEISPGG